MEPNTPERRLAAILAADVVGYSRLTAADEEGTVGRLRAYREVIYGLIVRHHGRVFGTAGDSVIAEFASPVEAVRCAIEMQRAVELQNAELDDERRMRFRIGVNLGDVMVEGDDLLGDGVNVAARLEAMAEPGGICISGTVHDHVRRHVALTYQDMGPQRLKNIPEPVQVFRVTEGTAAAPPGASASKAGPIDSIAVLPLENLSGVAEEEYFADGMTDTLIGDLAKIRGLRVISRTSVMQYKRVRKPLPEIARELNVRSVIEGTVLRDAGRVRLSFQLIDARTDEHLWAERYDRELSGVLALHSEVARTVADQIQLTLTPQERARLTTTAAVDPQAYDADLRGRHCVNAMTYSLGRERFDEGIHHFEDALRLDPGYASAHVGIASAYLTLGGFSGAPPREVLPKAKAAVLEALELDDELGRAHAVLGWIRLFYDWSWPEAERSFARALELAPSEPASLAGYGTLCSTVGRHEEAVALCRAAVDAAPLDPFIGDMLGHRLMYARRYDQAIVEYRRVLELNPDRAGSHGTLGHAYRLVGRVEEAIDSYLEQWALMGVTPSDLGLLRRAFDEHGLEGYWRALLIGLEQYGRTRYMSPDPFVQIHAALGDADQAFAWLEKCYDERSWQVSMVKTSYWFDPLRTDPRFERFVRRVGIPDG